MNQPDGNQSYEYPSLVSGTPAHAVRSRHAKRAARPKQGRALSTTNEGVNDSGSMDSPVASPVRLHHAGGMEGGAVNKEVEKGKCRACILSNDVIHARVRRRPGRPAGNRSSVAHTLAQIEGENQGGVEQATKWAAHTASHTAPHQLPTGYPTAEGRSQ